MSYEWTPERIARVRQMHGDGFSASQIARSISAPSRNSVCGKIARMGMTKKAGAKPQWRTTVVTKPIKPRPAPEPDPLPVHQPVTGGVPTEFLQSHHCKFPVSEDRPWLHCGAKREPVGPYCAKHFAIAFAKQPSSPAAKAKAAEAARVSGIARNFG